MVAKLPRLRKKVEVFKMQIQRAVQTFYGSTHANRLNESDLSNEINCCCAELNLHDTFVTD